MKEWFWSGAPWWTARRKPERTYYFIHCELCEIYS